MPPGDSDAQDKTTMTLFLNMALEVNQFSLSFFLSLFFFLRTAEGF